MLKRLLEELIRNRYASNPAAQMCENRYAPNG